MARVPGSEARVNPDDSFRPKSYLSFFAPLPPGRGSPAPEATSTVATRNDPLTSIRNIQSLATNVRNPPQPCGASIDWHSYVVS